jgi:hypothetical protein
MFRVGVANVAVARRLTIALAGPCALTLTLAFAGAALRGRSAGGGR